MLKYSEPAVSSGAMVATFCRRIAPVSMPGSTQNTVTPPSVSPLMSCHAMALPPRYFGNSDGWKQMLPRRGTAKTLGGTICVT